MSALKFFPTRSLRTRAFRMIPALGAMALLGACAQPDATEVEDIAPSVVTSSAELAVDRELARNGLVGSFRSAGDDAPVVLIVPGSGPTDRDGNNPMGVRASTYRMLADDLQTAGVSSLRIAKRGMFGSEAAGDPNAVTVEIYAQDYIDWAAALREETGRDCVYLLGHSEGGLMVSAAAAQDNRGICGVILMAAMGRPMSDILRDQLRANPANAPILDDALNTIDRLEAGERVDVSPLHPALQGMFAPEVQGFLISAFNTDPAELAAQVGVPVLILQGDRDIQVSMADAQLLADASGGKLVTLEGVNHVLKPAPKGRAGNMATYADPDLPLGEAVVPAITDFILR